MFFGESDVSLLTHFAFDSTFALFWWDVSWKTVFALVYAFESNADVSALYIFS